MVVPGNAEKRRSPAGENTRGENGAKPPLVLVAGPTASGKSDLALSLAQHLGGELICTDSMQVYRGLDIGTAKPTAEERGLVPHHQLDLVAPDETYSAGRYAREAAKVIEQISGRGNIPILVGGTGLYFRALVYGINDVPEIPEQVRERVLKLKTKHGIRSCWELLREEDLAGAELLHPNDSARVMRALEVVLATGNPLSLYRQRKPFSVARYPLHGVGIEWTREDLYRRINQRVHTMLEAGWIAEVRKLLVEYPPHLKPLQAIGYREIIAYLQGDVQMDEMVSGIQRRTRQYAKRQLTWFRKEAHIRWHTPGTEEQIMDEFQLCLERGGGNYDTETF